MNIYKIIAIAGLTLHLFVSSVYSQNTGLSEGEHIDLLKEFQKTKFVSFGATVYDFGDGEPVISKVQWRCDGEPFEIITNIDMRYFSFIGEFEGTEIDYHYFMPHSEKCRDWVSTIEKNLKESGNPDWETSYAGFMEYWNQDLASWPRLSKKDKKKIKKKGYLILKGDKKHKEAWECMDDLHDYFYENMDKVVTEWIDREANAERLKAKLEEKKKNPPLTRGDLWRMGIKSRDRNSSKVTVTQKRK